MSDLDEQEQRITDILAKHKTLDVNTKTLNAYLEYLKERLTLPCLVTGMEDFPWEERYVFGFGSQEEYERLKKTQPSYTDTYELLRLDEDLDWNRGILAHVKRVSDKKKFAIPLADLEATEAEAPNAGLLEDFSFWFVNYQ